MIKDDRLPLKEKFLTYYRDLPVQKLAAEYIGKSEDTITDWKRSDSDFSDQIANARAEWAMAKSKGVRSKEWLLERVIKDHFAHREEITGSNGQPFTIVTGNGFLPTGVEVNDAPEGTTLSGQQPIQSLSVASEGTKDNDSDLRTG